jgi:ParB/RepB/Spo0J family partition protein
VSKLSYEVTVKSIAWFFILEQLRRQVCDEADAQLTESIRKYGVLQPVGAVPEGDRGKLIWGHRRVRCAVAAELTEIPVVILHRNMTEGEFLTLQMLENVQRESLSPYDMYMGCVRLMEANKHWRQKDVAAALNLSEKSISFALSPAKLGNDWKEALKGGKVTLNDTAIAARLEAAEAQSGLLKLKLDGASPDAFQQAAQQAVRTPSQASRVKLPRITMRLFGSKTVTVSAADTDVDGLVEILQTALELARKAKREGIDVKTAEKVWKDKSLASLAQKPGKETS